MIKDDVKQKYLDLADSLHVPQVYREALKTFLDTYDGTNEKETNTFLVHTLVLILSFDGHLIKSEAFDKIKESHMELESDLKSLNEDLEIIAKNEPIPLPAV